MARAKSPEKRQAILTAAIQVIAVQGLEAPTAKIAKEAGIAEGSLFTYFGTKDELLNQLYLELKQELNQTLKTNFPADTRLKDRARHIWDQYLNWAVNSPEKRKVMNLLKVSDRITEASRAIEAEGMEPLKAAMTEVGERGAFAAAPGLASTALTALAEAAAEKMSGKPKLNQSYRDAGFDVFWRATK
ncbi:MAG TPA: TetR/AcrR family transcriptional regulator [Acidobacteriaceae bacterium]|jgi:AcrR family transcriptional regulator